MNRSIAPLPGLFFLVLGVLAFAVAFPGKTLGKPGAATAIRNLRNLVAFTPNLERALVSVSGDHSILKFRIEGDFAVSRLAMINPDSLLLAPPGKRFPDGLAVRVQKVRRTGGVFIVEGAPVTMSDLLPRGEGKEIALTPGDIEKSWIEPIPEGFLPEEPSHSPIRETPGKGSRNPAPGLAQGDVNTLNPAAGIRSAKDKEDLADHGTPVRPGNSRFWTKVRESAVFSTGVRLEWDLQGISGNTRLRVENPKLVFRRDHLSFSGKILLEAGLGFRPCRNLSFKQVLLKIRLKPIVLGMIGPVPLYVRPRIRILIKGRVSGSIGCAGSFLFEAPFLTGARRDPSGWKNISKASVTAQPRGITLDGTVGELSAKLFAGVAVDFFINDLAGPTLRTGLFVSPGAAATLIKSPKAASVARRPLLSVFKVKGGAELSIGGALSFLEKARFLVDIVRVEIPLYKLKIAGLEVSPSRLEVSPGRRIETSSLTLIPQYRQQILLKDGATIPLGQIPSDWGTWNPPPDANGLLPATEKETKRSFHVTISTLDCAQTLTPGSFDLIPAP